MEGPRSAIMKLSKVALDISDKYNEWASEAIVGDIKEVISIVQTDCMQRPCDCFGHEIFPDHLKYIIQNDTSKAVHTAKCIGLDPKTGEWAYMLENGEFKPCRSCYDPDNSISIIASEIADSMKDEDAIKVHELAKRIFAKFPR